MSKFTKGNWSIRRKEFHPPHIASENNLGVPICYMAACFDEDSANAHLISACPEMYEACKRAFNWLHVIISDFEIKNPENKDALMGLQNFIYKALSKAEGKE